MASLLVVSDDLTGAFDASVPFVGMGVDVVASPSSTHVGTLFADGGAAVLAVNAASRHMSPLGAYLRVSSIVESACEAGIPILLKKTDSVLRGNVGAELSALWGGHRQGLCALRARLASHGQDDQGRRPPCGWSAGERVPLRS